MADRCFLCGKAVAGSGEDVLRYEPIIADQVHPGCFDGMVKEMEAVRRAITAPSDSVRVWVPKRGHS